jgi:tetratricopeptide (TPR) repeat protein
MTFRISLLFEIAAAIVAVVFSPAPVRAQSGTTGVTSGGQTTFKGPGLSDEQTRAVRSAFLSQGSGRSAADIKQSIARLKQSASSAEGGFELAKCYEEMMAVATADVFALDGPIETARSAGQKQRMKNLEKQRAQREQKVSSWRDKAVKQLATVARDHPDYRNRDEVLYRLAFIIEEQAEDDRRQTLRQKQPVPSTRETSLRSQARMIYRQLIKNFPMSRFIPNAYLSFGEYYFNEGSMAEALLFYQRVVQFESSDAYGYAVYKTAWCHVNLQDHQEAVSGFVRVIQLAKTMPQARLSTELATLARREIVRPFSQAFPPNRAWAFFKRIGGNEAVWMMEGLAEQYYLGNQWQEAAQVYRSLIAENQGSVRVTFYRTRLAECERHIGP